MISVVSGETLTGITLDSDLEPILQVHRLAFGSGAEARLVSNLLRDESAEPVVSLLALDEGEAVGHVLFSAVRFQPEVHLSAALLAPLAVVPHFQGQGIGRRLIESGLERLAASGVDLVFVLGYPGYYSRFGFKPAGEQGWQAPYPVPPEDADAWMVRPLRAGVAGAARGQVICADSLNRPEYWRE